MTKLLSSSWDEDTDIEVFELEFLKVCQSNSFVNMKTSTRRYILHRVILTVIYQTLIPLEWQLECAVEVGALMVKR